MKYNFNSSTPAKSKNGNLLISSISIALLALMVFLFGINFLIKFGVALIAVIMVVSAALLVRSLF